MTKNYYLYIITNKSNTTFYIGMTNDLLRRIYQHRHEIIGGFSKKYKLHKLVYFEIGSDVKEVIAREKQLKNWHRDWKINLIKSKNLQFRDLYQEILCHPEFTSG